MEAAVYGEEVGRIAHRIVKLLEPELAQFKGDASMASSFAGAALASAAQIIDDAEYRREGVTGRIAVVVAMWLRNL